MPSMSSFAHLPSYDDLPAVQGMPHGCAWGLFDKNGVKDELGTLNFLTPDVVQRAVQEVKTGERVQLDCPLNAVKFPVACRRQYSHKIVDLVPLGVVSCDDELEINTQSSSQWDGLRHMAHQKSKLYYNGLHHDDILSGKAGLQLGTQNWVAAGGIVGRGVLLDWKSWMEAHGKEVPKPYTSYAIPLSELLEVAKYQGTEFQFGDILLVRTGFTTWVLSEKDESQIKKHIADKQEYIGVRADTDSARFFWDNHFSAFACDTMSFENWPPVGDVLLHEHFLSFWGSPIGELWNLDGLAALAKKNQKWTFLLTSAPLHVPGGVATPPNALAIF